jgi:hypothetical protein
MSSLQKKKTLQLLCLQTLVTNNRKSYILNKNATVNTQEQSQKQSHICQRSNKKLLMHEQPYENNRTK